MLNSYFKSSVRNILKNKTSNIINIIGLSLGIASATLIFSYVSFETQVDGFHKDPDRIFRMVRETTNQQGSTNYTTGSQLVFQKKLMEEWQDPEFMVPVYASLGPLVTILPNGSQSTVLNGSERKFLEDEEGIATTPEFFQVFNYPWLVGNPVDLAEPNTIALSQPYAEKYFGQAENALGQHLILNNRTLCRVVGVLKPFPLRSEFNPNLVLSYETKRSNPDDWGAGDFEEWGSVSSNDLFFVKLPAAYHVEKANDFLKTIVSKYSEELERRSTLTQSLQPFGEIHFDSQYGSISGNAVSRTLLWGISIIGLLIIFMACVNFINLSTALMNARMKEVGVRKTLGGGKRHIILQFLSETFLIALGAASIGLLVAWMGKPILSEAFGLPEEFSLFDNKMLLPFLLLTLLAVSLLAGIYPSLVMSNFSPLEAFRDRQKGKWQKGFSMRKALIVFQFSIAIFLILSTLINLEQMSMLQNKDLGYDKDGIVFFQVDPDKNAGFSAFRSKLEQLPGIESVSFSADLPSSQNNWSSNFAFDHRSEDEAFNTDLKYGDGKYFKTFGLKILAGKAYDVTDTVRRYLINETMMHKLGYDNPEEMVGKDIRVGGSEWQPILGVVKDFHVSSAKSENKPIVMASIPKFHWFCAVKIKSNNLVRSVDQIRTVHDSFYPESYFGGEFYEDYLQNYYVSETRLGILYKIAAGIAILIACLGLLGLAAYMTEQRKKEIGVRKVMGAGLFNILSLISGDFLILVGISSLVGLPAAYYLSSKWLQEYIFRVDISWKYFLVTLILALIISLASVSFHAMKAALLNPVKSLKSE